MVRDLLRGFVLAVWFEGVDLHSLEKRSEVRVSDRLERREQDLVWRLRRQGEHPWLYLLLEFQSEPDPHMDLRMRVYRDLLAQDLIRSGELPRHAELPPIVSLMLYNGNPGWAERGGPAPDTDKCRWIDVLRDPLPVEPDNLVALLFTLERSRSSEAIDGCVERLGVLLAGPEDAELRRAFTSFLRRSLLPARFPGAEIPALEDLEEIRPMLRDTVIGWTRQWQEEGRRSGEARLLLRLLERRFGPLSLQDRDRIETADEDLLLEWGERFVSARSLYEVLGG
jgi:hypothetical protein